MQYEIKGWQSWSLVLVVILHIDMALELSAECHVTYRESLSKSYENGTCVLHNPMGGRSGWVDDQYAIPIHSKNARQTQAGRLGEITASSVSEYKHLIWDYWYRPLVARFPP